MVLDIAVGVEFDRTEVGNPAIELLRRLLRRVARDTYDEPLGRRWAVERNNQLPRSGNVVQAQRSALALILASLRSAYIGRANGVDVKLQAAPTRERTSGAPLAAMHTQLTLSVCKRRDAVRLAQNEPARPAGAAFGGLSASAAS